MKVIKELIEELPNLNSNELRTIFRESEIACQFYKDIEGGVINSDEEAKNYYYGDKDNARVYYWRLKKQVFEKLSNVFISVPRKKATTVQQAYFEIYRDFFLANELRHRGKNCAFSVLAERVIEKALKYDIPDIVVSIGRKLLSEYSYINVNKKKYYKYKDIVQKAQLTRQAEENIEAIFYELAFLLSEKRNINPEEVIKFEVGLNDAENIFNHYPTLKIATYYYTIQVLFYEATNDVWSTLHYCKEAFLFFGKKKVASPKGTMFMFLHKQINLQIRLKQFEKARGNLKLAFDLVPKYAPNWYIVNSYAVTLHFHEGNYVKTHDIIHDVLSNRQEISEIMTEQWMILKAYAHLMSSNRSNFRLGKFLNEVPTFSKDKRGHNTNILILQVLFLLKKKKFAVIVDKVESLRQYASKYLRKENTFRTSCFIKMLCQLPAGNFHSVNVQRRTKNYHEKMMALPKEQARMDVDVEIVPYEVLWDKVLELLR